MEPKVPVKPPLIGALEGALNNLGVVAPISLGESRKGDSPIISGNAFAETSYSNAGNVTLSMANKLSSKNNITADILLSKGVVKGNVLNTNNTSDLTGNISIFGDLIAGRLSS